jgi:hypothetical protein
VFAAPAFRVPIKRKRAIFQLFDGGGPMDSAFGNWRTAMVGLGLTAAVFGVGLAIAFL